MEKSLRAYGAATLSFLLLFFAPLAASAKDGVVEINGVVQSMPASGLIGSWTIAGRAVRTDAATVIKQQLGAIGVGAVVEAKGVDEGNGVTLATTIEVKQGVSAPPVGHAGRQLHRRHPEHAVGHVARPVDDRRPHGAGADDHRAQAGTGRIRRRRDRRSARHGRDRWHRRREQPRSEGGRRGGPGAVEQRARGNGRSRVAARVRARRHVACGRPQRDRRYRHRAQCRARHFRGGRDGRGARHCRHGRRARRDARGAHRRQWRTGARAQALGHDRNAARGAGVRRRVEGERACRERQRIHGAARERRADRRRCDRRGRRLAAGGRRNRSARNRDALVDRRASPDRGPWPSST